MGDYAIPDLPIISLPSLRGPRFPIRRIFCVGQNYSEHAKEMGGNPETEPPFFFMKAADAVAPNGAVIPYPPATSNLHHEVELVVALCGGGRDIPAEKANELVYGYAVGLDMTRRDLQNEAKKKSRPWEMSKSFDFSAPCSAITPRAAIGVLAKGKIECRVNGQLRQRADIGDMTWEVPQIIHYLSQMVEIAPGDIIFTGTPAGVGPVVKGDKIEARIEGLEPLRIAIGAPAAGGAGFFSRLFGRKAQA